jgi:hypothetical protein
MNGAQIITKFRNMVDDQLDADFEYELLNDAKNEVEEMAFWEILKRTTSFSGASTAIPSNFSRIIRIAENNNYIFYDSIPIEDKDFYSDNAYIYYIDWENSLIVILDSNNTKTKNVYYQITSTDIDEGTEWVFPERFHRILPIKMAELYYAADAGEKGRAWDDRWAAQFERVMGQMYAWNDSLKLRNRKTRTIPNNPRAVNC